MNPPSLRAETLRSSPPPPTFGRAKPPPKVRAAARPRRCAPLASPHYARISPRAIRRMQRRVARTLGRSHGIGARARGVGLRSGKWAGRGRSRGAPGRKPCLARRVRGATLSVDLEAADPGRGVSRFWEIPNSYSFLLHVILWKAKTIPHSDCAIYLNVLPLRLGYPLF